MTEIIYRSLESTHFCGILVDDERGYLYSAHRSITDGMDMLIQKPITWIVPYLDPLRTVFPPGVGDICDAYAETKEVVFNTPAFRSGCKKIIDRVGRIWGIAVNADCLICVDLFTQSMHEVRLISLTAQAIEFCSPRNEIILFAAGRWRAFAVPNSIISAKPLSLTDLRLTHLPSAFIDCFDPEGDAFLTSRWEVNTRWGLYPVLTWRRMRDAETMEEIQIPFYRNSRGFSSLTLNSNGSIFALAELHNSQISKYQLLYHDSVKSEQIKKQWPCPLVATSQWTSIHRSSPTILQCAVSERQHCIFIATDAQNGYIVEKVRLSPGYFHPRRLYAVQQSRNMFILSILIVLFALIFFKF